MLAEFLEISGLKSETIKIYEDYKNGLIVPEKAVDLIKKNISNYYLPKTEQESLIEILGINSSQKNPTKDDLTDAISIRNPGEMPDPNFISAIFEPFLDMDIILPETYTGKIIELINNRRGSTTNISALSIGQIKLSCSLPLSEVIIDFYDELKSLSKGYASMSYEITGYQKSDLVKIDFLLNSKIIEPLSIIRHRSIAEKAGRTAAEKLKEVIPRQQIEVAIQAVIGAKVIARETVKPFRKDVTAKLYGGDITRRMKLLDKQKAGKKRMRSFGNVEVPKEAFLDFLK